MYINQPYFKGTSKKHSTVSKAINQFEFSDHRLKRSEHDYNKQREEATERKKKSIRNKSRQFEKEAEDDQLSTKMKGRYKRRRDRSEIDFGVDGILDLIDKNSNNRRSYQGQTKDEREFQQDLVLELGELLRRCTSSIQRLNQKVQDLDEIKETQSQIKAFEHCQHLLECENENEQKINKAGKEMMKKKFLQVENYKLRILKEIEDVKQQIRQIKKEGKKNEDELNEQKKIEKNKNNFREKIKEEEERIQKIKKKLMECKQESYKQKNQFIILQAEEFKKMEEIENYQKLEQDYQQNIIRKAKYDKLAKIKEKVLQAKDNIQEEIKPHLQRKINKMAQLRSEMSNIDEALSLCTAKSQDQLIIIEALKEKSYHEENFRSQQTKNLFETYKSKYNQIYFGTDGKQGQNNSWSDYSNYLKQLINRNAELNKRVHTQIPKSQTSSVQGLRKKRNSNIGSINNSQYIDNDILDLRTNKNPKMITSQRFYEGQSNKNKGSTRGGTLKLPKLVKLQGNEQKQIKEKVKEGIQNKRGKEDDFQLQSVDSNDSKVSGSIIEVQFHKK